MQPNESPEVFDATIETEKIEKQPTEPQISLEDARIRAEHQTLVTANLVDDIISQKKKSFRRTVIFSVSSVVILLILAIVFFVYLRWYGVGAGVAVLTFVVAQIWLHFFKKWNYNAREDDDFGDESLFLNTEDERLDSDLSENSSKNSSNEGEGEGKLSQNEEKTASENVADKNKQKK